jgi:GH15 family glucan-1,4-alpha-glucosidase
MPRDLPLGNGKVLVAFDGDYRLRELCYPHVGCENHVRGALCRFGVFVDGAFT